MHSGSCLCAAVKYRIDAPIDSANHCHCVMCRKAHGAAFATYVNVRRKHFHFTQGEESLGLYHSSPGVTRTFCKNCGSTLQWYSEQPHPNWLSVALGTLDTAVGEIAQTHIYPESKADWYTINDGLPVEQRS